MFSSLKRRGFLTEKQMKYFTYEVKKGTNFGKLYLLPMIYKRLHNVPGTLVISNCRSPTEKCTEFLDHHLKPIMQIDWSYIKDSADFINKTKNLSTIPNNAIIITADVVVLSPSISHETGLRALREALDKQDKKCIPTGDLVKMAELVLKNNFFEFNSKIKQQVSGTAIGTKFAPPYACLFMDKFEKSFLEVQQLQPLVWFRYISDVFFIWTHCEEERNIFLKSLNEFDPCIKFTHESNKEIIAFFDIKVSLRTSKVFTDLYVKPTDRHQYLHYLSAHPYHTKRSVVFSQTLRISRLCSSEKDFQNHKEQMKSRFRKRKYPEDLISSEMSKVRFSNLKLKSNDKNHNMKGKPLVVTYILCLNL